MEALKQRMRRHLAPRNGLDSSAARQPLRSELLSIELLKRHAATLAQRHKVGVRKGFNLLLPRLSANEEILRKYNDETLRAEEHRRITPASEWLLDNFHLIEEQIRTARRHLPRGFSRELPHLVQGPSVNFPRVYDLALELISHVDGRIDAAHLTSFVTAYQEVTQLKLGELWAIPIMLRLALIENLRRIAALLTESRKDRDAADVWADRMLQVAEDTPSKLIVTVGEMAQAHPTLSQAFVAEFWRRIQDKYPALRLPVNWIEERLSEDNLTIEQVVQSESQHQAANQVSVGNSICSLRFLDAMDWREFVETQSVVEQKLRADPADVYGKMDFATRDSYRHTVERIAKQSRLTELEVAALAIELAKKHDGDRDGREGHVGFYLAGKGEETLAGAAHVKRLFGAWLAQIGRRHPLAFYLGGILAVAVAVTLPLLLWVATNQPPVWSLALLALVSALSASQLGVVLVNWLATVFVRTRALPRFDFSAGVPPSHATLVAVPTMLTSLRGIKELLESMEVRYLANRDDSVFFASLSDFRDAAQEHLPGDEELVRRAAEGIQALNEKYKSDRPCIFYLFHRPRLWNETEQLWMGYERKRGKLAALNRCLRGGSPECFSQIAGDLSLLPHIQYVITLDTDTQLPRDTARQLAATMAHPLNRPVFDPQREIIVDGYSILQPRMAVSLPSAQRSRFVKLFSGDPGIDPYTRAVSDVYQDVFHEGSFIGKGIYDVDAFERVLGGRFPENRILSHDLLEGSYARSALVSDVQLFEDFPARYHADVRRRHRWIRGDWQIATWLLPRLPGPDIRRVSNPLTGLSRWKIFDNLRRSLVPPCLLVLLLLGWLGFPAYAFVWGLFLTATICLPFFLASMLELVKKPRELPWQTHGRNVSQTAAQQTGQAILTLMFLPYDACVSLDAIIRTLGRLLVTHRHLLEWQTASEAEQQSGSSLKDFLATMWTAPALALMTGLALHLGNSQAWASVVPFLALWALAPVAAWWISLPLKEKQTKLSTEQILYLRKLTRKTWRFFEMFVGPEDHWLPPDNFQENPKPVLAARTSPTNIGMASLCTLSAYDFGYLSQRRLVDRLAVTFGTLGKLERFEGHYFNWYDTRTLAPLPPQYVSTVDNGNLAALLLTLHSGLLEMADQKWSSSRAQTGLRDTLLAWKEETPDRHSLAELNMIEVSLIAPGDSPREALHKFQELIAESQKLAFLPAAQANRHFEWWRKTFEQSCRDHQEELEAHFPWLKLSEQIEPRLTTNDPAQSCLREFWHHLNVPQSLRHLSTQANRRLAKLDELLMAEQTDPETVRLLIQLRALLESSGNEAARQITDLEKLAQQCRELAQMDFTLLYDRSRELFSIGYNVGQHRLDGSCYDLLASEARLVSFVCIALGQLPQRHWFALGRLLTTAGGDATLISWSGSMFEYLMPMLVMPAYENTLIDLSCRSAVARQIEYGKQMDVPWGISESGYNLRDTNANYQYRAFGVPGLGFKRGLAEDIVIAPYATLMALMFAPREACRNLERLSREGAEGKYGFYEAIDFTASRVPRGQTRAIVQSFMAHHQGMSLLSLETLLLDRPMQRRFNSNPIFKSAELLLHERVPKAISVLYPHELEASASRETSVASEVSLRVFTDPNAAPPEVQLLSNGRYHVMVTHAGGGYSHWNDIALTRWREDATRDCWGTFIYLRDVDIGGSWSAAYQPTLQATPGYEAIFSQGRAEFRSRFHDLDVHTEISVSPEDDVEVRRVTLTNHSHEIRTIEVTSFAEVVLNTQAADVAHPAFSNLFVQTQILRDKHAILCARRPRSSGDQLPCMFHLLLAQGTEVGQASYETDRSRFVGRGRNPSSPAALRAGSVLSDSEGSVLDPIVAIRRTVRIAPKESACLTLVSGIAATQESLSGLIEKYQDQTIADRCFELAWTHGLIVLRHLNTTEAEAQLYGQLAGALLYQQALRRTSPAVMSRNRRGQRNLWSFGISGDLPIVVVHSNRSDRLDLVREVVQAHAYWRLKGLMADLVILNEDDSVYRQSLHDQILTFITSGNAAQLFDKPGGIFTRRIDQLSSEDLVLLETAARVVLSDDNGTLAKQLQRRVRPSSQARLLAPRTRRPSEIPPELPARDLVFFNGLGGFTRDGREYVITLQPGQVTPAPWVNVLANPNFGTLISESGGSYSWAENCHEFRLTPWNNDSITDLNGEAFYVRDDDSGRFWSPSPLPARGQGAYVCRHGFGYSVFEHTEESVASELWVYVAVDAPVKFAQLKLRNLSPRPRRLSVTGYWEWVLGELREKSAMHVATELEPQNGAVLVRNHYNTDFEGRVAFVASSEPHQSFTCDRSEFLGRNGTPANPSGLSHARLSGKTGVALDPCAALQVPISLGPGEERTVVFTMGAGRSIEQARQLIQNFKNVESSREALNSVWGHWNHALTAVHVETPEPALNILANGWLLYQTLSCRLWARTGFYQSGGAFGFRDQLQDAMALVHARPVLLREQLLRAAAHQFREGDVQHWWHPPHDRGVRTHFSDDYLWLPVATCRYVETTGDTGVLEEAVPFLEGRPVRPEEEAYYDSPQHSQESAPLYEHCARAIRNGLKFGEHGLPLIGCGDWNDGMNMIGEHGKGESVWLAFFLYDVLEHFALLAIRRGDAGFAKLCKEHARQLRDNIEKNAWDGQWYRRAYFDNGEPLGSASNPECQIDALPQSWSVISGAGNPNRSRIALEAVADRLVRNNARLIQLFDPPFDKSPLEPGYIKGYVPGVRENGGQYTHAAIWTVMAFALAGDTQRAWELFTLINPVLHAHTPAAAARYKVEPYVVAADVYSVSPHTGRGGWTWYTGSAGWMYRLITETLLGLTVQVDRLRFTPRVPVEWKSFKLHYRFRNTNYHIVLNRNSGDWQGTQKIIVDEQEQATPFVSLVDDQRDHKVEIRFDRL